MAFFLARSVPSLPPPRSLSLSLSFDLSIYLSLSLIRSLSLSFSVQNVSRTLLRASSTCHLRPLSSPISSSFPRICGQFGAVKPQTNRKRTRHTAPTVPSHFEKYPGKMIRPLLRWRSLYFLPFPSSIRLFPFSLPLRVRFSVSHVILRNPSSFLFSNVSSNLFLIFHRSSRSGDSMARRRRRCRLRCRRLLVLFSSAVIARFSRRRNGGSGDGGDGGSGRRIGK